jgi:hypothetical protein
LTAARQASPGMKTASMSAPSESFNPYLMLPSDDGSLRAISGSRIGSSRPRRIFALPQ